MRKLFIVLILIAMFILSACSSPKLTINAGQDTVEINTTWVDAGAVAVIGDETINLTTTDKVDSTKLGQYEIVYSYQDKDDTYTITRYVQVVDQTPPIITLNSGVDTIKAGNQWVDAGATVTDNSLEELTITVSGEVDINTVGTYEVTYSAIDSSGNTAKLIRYVDVLE